MMQDSFIRFLNTLAHADLALIPEEIAEALWLAQYLSLERDLQATLSSPLPDVAVPQDREKSSPSNSMAPKDVPKQESSPNDTAFGNLYTSSSVSSYGSGSSPGGKLTRMPAAPVLKNPLALERALRPLRQKRRSRTMLALDEKATVEQIAEMDMRVWAPVLQQAFVRHFELALVVDESDSMFLWEQDILEIKALFERLGAFRDVRMWKLATNDSEQVHLYAGLATDKNSIIHTPEELIDPNGRRLILVITDCVSPAWYSGKVQSILESWGKTTMVTLLQMLPQRLWKRTALSATEQVYVTASSVGAANSSLKPVELAPWLADELSIPLPIITFNEEPLAGWAKMVVGTENTSVAGVMFDKNLPALFASPLPQPKTQRPLSAGEQVRNFMAAVSPPARQLARLLAAIPISLPIVRIVQQTMLPTDSTQAHVAEVFLSGLLREVSRDNAHIRNPEYVTYEFSAAIRDELLAALPMPDEYQVVREVSKFIAERLGFPRDFFAYADTPLSETELVLSPGSLPFAQIAAPLWRKLGGNYEIRANQLKQYLAENGITKDKEGTTIKLGDEQPSQVEQQIVQPDTELQEGFNKARAIKEKEARAVVLIELIFQLPELRMLDINEIIEIMHGIPSDGHYVRAWLKQLPNVPVEFQPMVIKEVLASTSLILDKEMQITVLDELLVSPLPERWKRDVVLQTLETSRRVEHEKLRPQMLGTLLRHAPEPLQHLVMREIQLTQGVSSQALSQYYIPTRMRTGSLGITCICPSCFNEIYLGECRIVSGVTKGKVLKKGSKGIFARTTVEPLNGRKYILELARRECTKCHYLLPSDIEDTPSLTIAIVGEVFSGKSHYIASLIHQLQTEWMSNSPFMMQLTCPTPDVEQEYTQKYFRRLYIDKQIIDQNQVATQLIEEPLIYKLVLQQSSRHPKKKINLMFYDVAGEAFESEPRLMQVAKFAVAAENLAFIFVTDPVGIPSVYDALSPQLQAELHSMFGLRQGRKPATLFSSIISTFQRFHRLPEGSLLPNIPIAMMLSKTDLIDTLYQSQNYAFMSNPHYGDGLDLRDIDAVDKEMREFLHTHQQGDLIAATRRYKEVKFFGTSATGEPPDEQGRYKQVHPRRCLDPLLWILNRFDIINANVE